MHGLVNIGNTCWINTLVQCLGHSPRLREHILRCNVATSASNTFTIFHELQLLLYQMWVQGADLIPKRFVFTIHKNLPFLDAGSQHDLCELWTMMCEQMAKECFQSECISSFVATSEQLQHWKNKEPAYARMIDSYNESIHKHNRENASQWLHQVQGVWVNQIHCPSCSYILHNFEPFTVVCLDMEACKEPSSLYDCFRNLLQTDVIECYTCDRCKTKGTVEKLVRFWKLPPVLTVCMKRFKFDGDRWKKNRQYISIPKTMEFHAGSVLGPDDRASSVQYVLKSIGLHHGQLQGGHYTALCDVNGSFVHYDDMSINRNPEVTMDLLRDAYMFVYERV